MALIKAAASISPEPHICLLVPDS